MEFEVFLLLMVNICLTLEMIFAQCPRTFTVIDNLLIKIKYGESRPHPWPKATLPQVLSITMWRILRGFILTAQDFADYLFTQYQQI